MKSISAIQLHNKPELIVDDSKHQTKHIRSAGIGIPDKRRAIMSSLSLIKKFLDN